MSWGKQVASRCWERHENGFSRRNSQNLGSRTSSTVRGYPCVVLSHWFCGGCYSIHRKLTHQLPSMSRVQGRPRRCWVCGVRKAESSSHRASVKRGNAADEGGADTAFFWALSEVPCKRPTNLSCEPAAWLAKALAHHSLTHLQGTGRGDRAQIFTLVNISLTAGHTTWNSQQSPVLLMGSHRWELWPRCLVNTLKKKKKKKRLNLIMSTEEFPNTLLRSHEAPENKSKKPTVLESPPLDSFVKPKTFWMVWGGY